MIHISNKEWLDSYGNTYFSAECYLGNDLIMSMPMQYGYNESCRQVFDKAFCKHFKIDYGINPGGVVRETLGKNGIKISVSTRDVKKRDLNKGEAFQDFSAFLKPENLALYASHRMREGIKVVFDEKGYLIEAIINPDTIVLEFGHAYEPLETCKFSNVNWF